MSSRPAARCVLLCLGLSACAAYDDPNAPDASRFDSSDGATPDAIDADATIAAPLDASDLALDADLPQDEGPMRRVPTNVSFETARRVLTEGSSLLQDEVSADQVDFFVFEAEAGAYYEVTTDRHSFSPDNVIAVYDEDRTLLAENDNGGRWGGDAIDARVLVKARQSGDCFVRVEDLWTPQAFFASAFPLLYYHLGVRKLEVETEGIALAGGQALVEVQLATDEVTGFRYATLLGAADSGPTAFELDGAGEAVIGRMLRAETPVFADGTGWSEVELVDEEQTVIASIRRALGQEALHPPVSNARYELRVTPETSAEDSEHGFYAIDVVLIPENPLEMQDEENGAFDGAEPIEMEGTAVRRGLLLTTLPSDDLDYYRFDAELGERVSVLCEGESGGSRVRGLRAELLDPDQVSLGTGEESPTLNLEIVTAPLEQAGTHYVRLSTTSHDAEGFAAWARCAVTVGR